MNTKYILLVVGCIFLNLSNLFAQSAETMTERKEIILSILKKTPVFETKNRFFQYEKDTLLFEKKNLQSVSYMEYKQLYQKDSLLEFFPYPDEGGVYIKGKIINKNYQALAISNHEGYSFWSLVLLIYDANFNFKDIMFLAESGGDFSYSTEQKGYFINDTTYSSISILKDNENENSKECHITIVKSVIHTTGAIKVLTKKEMVVDCSKINSVVSHWQCIICSNCLNKK